MKSTFIGKAAEDKVAFYLKSNGFTIIDKNWRTRVCEIDLIVKKKEIIYFVEVKFRSSDKQGEGFEYITNKKLKQMNFAAEIWVQQNTWEGDYRLIAASVNEENKVKFIEI